jgi:hypothetical protein
VARAVRVATTETAAVAAAKVAQVAKVKVGRTTPSVEMTLR